MHGNRLWVAFLVVVIGLAGWFSARAGIQVYQYARLDRHTPAMVEGWSVEQRSRDRFGLDATYSYEVDGEHLKRTTPVPSQIFLNAYAAKKGAVEAATREWHTWYSSKHPDVASLEKHFPVKNCLYAVLVLGVLAYLLLLGKRMASLEDFEPDT